MNPTPLISAMPTAKNEFETILQETDIRRIKHLALNAKYAIKPLVYYLEEEDEEHPVLDLLNDTIEIAHYIISLCRERHPSIVMIKQNAMICIDILRRAESQYQHPMEMHFGMRR